MKAYVGIDPATKTGYAVIDEEGNLVFSGTWNLSRRAGDGAGMIYVRFSTLFIELLESTDYEYVVAYEQQANRFAGAAAIGLGIISQLQFMCENRGIPYTGATFSVIKKHATGKGNASKVDMMDAAARKYRKTLIIDDNHADAIWIADALREGIL